MILPKGNGYFVWLLSRTAAGVARVAAEMAQKAGLGWVAIKIADGPYSFNVTTSGFDQAAEFTQAFRTVGIQVFGWQYIYGYMPREEAQMGARRAKQLGLDGFIIDAESEMKKKPSQASQYWSTLRLSLPDIPIGICSFRYPSYHREFPWDVFRNCDFNMPQVYWMQAHNAGFQLQKTVSEFASLKYRMPLIPIGAAFTEFGWATTKTDIFDFRATAKKLGLNDYGWWEWYDATVRNVDWWNASTDTVISTPPPSVLRRVVTRFTNLRIRSGPSLNDRILGYMSTGRIYDVIDIQGPWGRLAADTPTWVNLPYTVTVG